MIEKKFVELQNGDVVEIHIEGGRWKYLVAGGEEFGEWDATLIPPDGVDDWKVRGRRSDGETENLTVFDMGKGEGLDYDAATALAMGFMASRHDDFGYFAGRPYSYSVNAETGVFWGEALPESKAKRSLHLAPNNDGFWVATCLTSYWDEGHRYFMMKPLEIVLGAGRRWGREEAMRKGLHWLVHASFI
ncbi:hypothetical protein NFO65_18420 [Neorhizobium galegae]|uniref:hypothetical protein n=1 Tax=Neorhizobium galegae TaxID=399 RepID=UPI0021014837|nr:hypothetical protein [Neorhizobium galegae]MCQ1572707.1 hypothetical protein [Neorhizobium galegae]